MVEWTRLSGDQVEELVGTLLCRKYPAAVRIRPSTGDGGIDLLVPGPDSSAEVYQVKKFASNLTTSQKSQIKESLQRLEQHRINHSNMVTAWHLTLPLDPTNENLQWLAEITSDLPYSCDWRGLSFIDGLAAEFPDVVDYYVGNGRQRLETVVGQLISAMGMKPNDGDGLVSPSQLSDYLQSLAPVVDTDPHFRYEVSLGPMKPYVIPEPGMILAMIRSVDARNDNAVTVRVFPRFAAAPDFRPIPIKFVIRAEPNSELQHELAAFTKYGTSVSVPIGAADIKMDLPGGLGGDISNAELHIMAAQSSVPSRVLRMVAVDPNADVVGSVLIDIQPPTFGIDGTGASLTGTERGGNFRIQMLIDLSSQTLTMSISGINVEGHAPPDVVTALNFLNALHPPNRLTIAAQHGPMIIKSVSLPDDFGLPDGDFLQMLARTAASLATIQEHTTAQLAMPGTIMAADAANWRAAELLLLGEEVSLNTTGVRACLRPGRSAPEGKFAIASCSEFAVTVGPTEVPIGTILAYCPIAEVDPESVEQHNDHIDCSFRPADNATVTARLVSKE